LKKYLLIFFRYIRDSSSGEECIIVGILSRDSMERNEGAVSFWLDIGVDQVGGFVL
jgi:hypothetical protein